MVGKALTYEKGNLSLNPDSGPELQKSPPLLGPHFSSFKVGGCSSSRLPRATTGLEIGEAEGSRPVSGETEKSAGSRVVGAEGPGLGPLSSRLL